ncbi:MAG: hypothetical protein CMJ18_04720 [Phycisphaeraceae bacterium]|nr:hypothetical protein [Phycisphaeraceae bacterium]
MPKAVRISLANKCQLLFGAAVILIVTAALVVVGFRMEKLVRESEEDHVRRTARMWINDKIQLVDALKGDDPKTTLQFEPQITLKLIDDEDFDDVANQPEPQRDHFLTASIRMFQTTSAPDRFTAVHDGEGRKFHRYVLALRQHDLAPTSFEPDVDTTFLANPLEKVLLIQFPAQDVERKTVLNRIYIFVAGLVAMLLAIGAFWFITTRIILSPVRVLRDTAEKIAEGDTNIRSDINTGDEFEQLSDMFNTMVSTLNAKEQELRQSNKSLDLKLGELAQHNVALFEANKIKGEFLANVSHELRTPLHGIIGFAEVLEETLDAVSSPTSETLDKRRRYLNNIVISSRRLLDLINDLLDLAKIEAGRLELHVAPMPVEDTCEALVTLIRTEAEKAGIDVQMRVSRDIPMPNTDAGKVHQIVFNFLSNAIKFTPRGGTVTLRSQVVQYAGEDQLSISVTDTGPGIPAPEQEKIFDKFTQLDATVTKEHGGTGLGLTISRDLARFLQGRIELQSEEGHGATFSLVIPFELKSTSVPLMPDLVT